jgi:hypothetical protein
MLEAIARSFLYHPTRIPAGAALPHWARSCEEVWLEASDGNRIHGLYWRARPARPTILFLHGNAQSVFEWSLVADELRPLESGLLLIDYPGYGKSSGTPNEEGLYAAGRAALDWLVEAGIPEGRTVVFGKSLGGGVATEIVSGRRVMGLVLESTFRSIPHVTRYLLPMIPTGAALRSERYDSASRIGAIDAPVLVVHGTADQLIPVAEGRALHELATGPKSLYLVEGAGHNDVSLVAGSRYAATLRAWLDGLETRA